MNNFEKLIPLFRFGKDLPLKGLSPQQAKAIKGHNNAKGGVIKAQVIIRKKLSEFGSDIVVKSYSFHSIEQIEKDLPEMIYLADNLKARVMIDINPRELETLVATTCELLDIYRQQRQYKAATKASSTAYGKTKKIPQGEKKFYLVDLDSKPHYNDVKSYLDSNKITRVLDYETPNGFHFIIHACNRVAVSEDLRQMPFEVCLQPNGQAILYTNKNN